MYSNFVLDGQRLQFFSEFRYLGHIITNSLCVDADIHRKMHNMYYRTNTLVRIFGILEPTAYVFMVLHFGSIILPL